MILRIDGTEYRGRAVTVESSVDPATVARAVRKNEATDDDHTVTVQSRTPHPVHERVGCLHLGMGLHVRTALAAAGRARGLSTPYDSELQTVRDRIEALSPDAVDITDQRRAVAEASAETDRLREQVAETRGRLAARRDLDCETDGIAADLETTARDLSEAETSAVAARQNLARRREDARSVRDTLDRRMALEDELANLQRRARQTLVDRLREAYTAAVDAAPGGPHDRSTDPFDVDPVTAGLAIARLASFDAPVVLACNRFPDARAASTWLDAPLIYVR